MNNDKKHPKKRRGLKWVGIILILLVVLAIGLLAFLPAILSSGAVQTRIVNGINDSIPGTIQIDDLTFSWGGPQVIDGIALDDPQGQRVLAIDSVSTELGLQGAVFGNYDLGETVIDALDADIVTDASGVTNLQKALGQAPADKAAPADEPPAPSEPGQPSEPTTVPDSLSGTIRIVDGNIRLEAPDTGEVQFNDINTAIGITDIRDPITLDASLVAAQDGRTGSLDAEGELGNLFGPDGQLTVQQARGNFTVTAQDLPVAGLDQLAGMNGLLTAALGETLDLNLTMDGTPDQMDLVLSAQAPHLNAALSGQYQGETFALAEPASVEFTLTPELLRAYARTSESLDNNMQLSGPVPVTLTLQRLNTPVDGFDPAALSIAAEATIGDGRITGDADLGTVAFSDFRATIDTEGLDEALQVTLLGQLTQQGETGRVNVDATVNNLYSEAGELQLDAMIADINAALTDFPMTPIDRLSGQEGQLVDLVGPRLNLTATATTEGDMTMADLNINTARLTANLPLAIDDTIRLRAPGEARYSLAPGTVKRYGNTEIAEPVQVDVRLSEFAAPLPKGDAPAFQPGETRLDATASIAALTLVDMVGETEEVTFRDINLTIDSNETLHDMTVTFSGEMTQPQRDGTVVTALGPVTAVDLTAEGGIRLDAGGEMATDFPDVTLTLDGENIEGTLLATLGDTLTLDEPATIRVTLTPAALAKFSGGGADQPTLAEPATLNLTLNRLVAPAAGLDYRQLQLDAQAAIAEMRVEGGGVPAASLRDAQVDVRLNGSDNTLSLAVEGEAAAEGESAPLTVKANVNNFIQGADALDFSKAAINVTANTSGLPSSLAGVLTGMAGKVEALVGPQLALDLTADLKGFDQGTVDVKATGERLNLDAGLNLGNTITLTRKATAKITLTPGAYSALTAPAEEGAEPSSLTLTEPATINATINKLTWPGFGATPGDFDPADAGIVAEVSIDRIALRNAETQQTSVLENLTGGITGENLARPVSVQLDSGLKVQRQTAEGQPEDLNGTINLDGELTDLLTAEGVFNATDLSADLTLKVAGLSGASLDDFMGSDEGYFNALLGRQASLAVDADLTKMTGPVTVDVDSTNSTLHLALSVMEQNLTLREDLTGKVEVTPELSQTILKDVNPLLVTAVSSDEPVQFRVGMDGFLIPRDSEDMAGLQVESASMTVGKVQLANGGLLRGLMRFLKRDSTGQMDAEFSPMQARIEDGVATYDRTDILIASSFRVATWGEIDLVRDQVDMTMGITAETLDKAFGIEGLEPDYVLQLPITGPTGNTSVDWGQAARRVAGMLAGREIGKEAPGLGGLIGNILGGGDRGPDAPDAPTLPSEKRTPTPAPASGEGEAATSGAPTPTPKPRSREEGVMEGLRGLFRN